MEVISKQADTGGTTGTENEGAFCRGYDNEATTLPRYARLPINRCNIPAVILGSLTFQQYPTPLKLDSVAELHADLFRRLDRFSTKSERASAFCDYLTVRFCLEQLEEAGLTERSKQRAKANWMRALRGWSFDSDGREGAVLKGWVESRFGLLPRFHGKPLRDFTGPTYLRYQEMRSAGLYGTNALESQLDLLYAYSQYEYQRESKEVADSPGSIELYRGINRIAEHEVLEGGGKRQVVLFNNMVSFTASRERASEFGDYILTTQVPKAKIFFNCDLLPGVLKGENEYLVIGGVYDIAITTF
ncbi:MAG: NAD(+)--dinitrogen-reductase ADP-D-ribosyltransferase [Betaproteobacteria bacterium]